MLYQINHDAKSKLWCGPAAIAAVTGQPTSVIRRVLTEIRGGATKGIYNHEMLDAMRRLGYLPTKQVRVTGDKRLTLAAFAAKHRELFAQTPMIVQVSHHYVVLAGRRMVDNHTKDPVWISAAPHRRRAVEYAWTFTKVGEARLPQTKPRDNTMAKARALAAKHDIKIERDGRSAWWVTCPALADDDPLEGNQWAASPGEALGMVEHYVECLTTGYLEAVTEPPTPSPPACPETTTAAVEFVLHRDGSDTPMGIACSLSLLYARDITERQVRGAALQLIRAGKARYFRGKLKLLRPNTTE